MIAALARLLVLPAAAQPLTNPAIFGKSGFGAGAWIVGLIAGFVVFSLLKRLGDELRWRKGKPALGHACVALGAVAGAAVFYAVVFKL